MTRVVNDMPIPTVSDFDDQLIVRFGHPNGTSDVVYIKMTEYNKVFDENKQMQQTINSMEGHILELNTMIDDLYHQLEQQ